MGYVTDITIVELSPNWENVSSFIQYLLEDRNKMIDKINMSNEKLKEVFKNLFYKLVPDLNYEDIFFTLCNVQYLAVNETKMGFKYILSFNAESKSDVDFFTYNSWNTSFESELLIDAYKE